MTMCKNEGKELIKLSTSELKQCGCDQCMTVHEEKRIEFLEAYYEQNERDKMAVEKGKALANQFKKAVQEEEKAIEDRAIEIFREELSRDGIDLNRIHGLRTVVQKMNFDISPRRSGKRVYTNSKYGRQELEPETLSFLEWAATGVRNIDTLAWEGDDGASGSIVVPEELLNRIVELRDRGSIMRQAGAQVIPMSSDTMRVPVETSIGSAEIQTQQGTEATGVPPEVTQVKLEPLSWFHEVAPSTQLLRDNAVNLAEYFVRVFSRSMIKLENQMFIGGDGTNQPEGIDQATIPTVAPVDGDPEKSILQLFYALDAEYRENAAWFFHGEFLAQVAQALSDKWFQTFADGQPSRLLGRPVFETTHISDPNTFYFGDPYYYFIGERDRLIVSRSEHAYWAQNRVAFKAEQRVDGRLGSAVGWRKMTYSGGGVIG